MNLEQKFFTITEASVATGYSVDSLRDFCKRGIVRPERIALGRLFSQADVWALRARREKTVKRAD